MRFKKITFVFLLYLCHVQCTKRKSNLSKEDDSETTHHQNKQHDSSDLPHKLERAPIPAVHTGPQPRKLETRSAPIALDNRYETKNNALQRVNRHISPSNNSPNPQKPSERNEVGYKENTNSTHFYHPGLGKKDNVRPNNTYNYYNIGKIYGSAYQYGPDQPFKGYRETPNIGVVPPRNANAKKYYNDISGFKDLPIIGQHSDGTFQSLYGSQKYSTYGYGYGSRDYVKNAYKNVLTGLAMWNIMNGLTNGRKYSIYNHTTLPQDFSRHINLDNNAIKECLEEVSVLCQGHAEPLCTTNGTTYCVTTAVITCRKNLSNCANITIPCEDCEDGEVNYLPCAANITVISDDKKDTNEGVLCVTTLIVPKENNACSNRNCLGDRKNDNETKQ